MQTHGIISVNVKEPIADVYRDLGAYALIYLCLLDEGKRNTPLAGYTYTEGA
jgi:hypothetical protein